MSHLDEYTDILNKIHEHNLQFLGLIDMPREEAIDKLSKLKFSTYNALRASVNYHASKPLEGLNITAATAIACKHAPIESVSRESLQPRIGPTKYTRVLDPATDANEIDPKYLSIRAEYLNELRALENSPGCSGCQRGKLRRKFIEKLTALDKANSES
jgi:hypothetical protein